MNNTCRYLYRHRYYFLISHINITIRIIRKTRKKIFFSHAIYIKRSASGLNKYNKIKTNSEKTFSAPLKIKNIAQTSNSTIYIHILFKRPSII